MTDATNDQGEKTHHNSSYCTELKETAKNSEQDNYLYSGMSSRNFSVLTLWIRSACSLSYGASIIHSTTHFKAWKTSGWRLTHEDK